MEDMDLRPDIELGLMREGQRLGALLSRTLRAVDEVLERHRPDIVVVQGDTTSATAASLASYLERIPVAHVEAGLRSGEAFEPFPEEANRRVISQLATLHFAATSSAARQLEIERVPSPRIHVTGNTVIDALLETVERYPRPRGWSTDGPVRLLVTLHRRESLGAPLAGICRALLALVVKYPRVRIHFPVHPAPAVRRPAYAILGNHPRIELVEPLPYPDFVAALNACYFVLTDSGGVQEEAPALGTPVLVLRNATERVEAIDAGTAMLVGTSPKNIVRAASWLLDTPAAHQLMSKASNPYGDGRASERIAYLLLSELGVGREPKPPAFEVEAPSEPVKMDWARA